MQKKLLHLEADVFPGLDIANMQFKMLGAPESICTLIRAAMEANDDFKVTILTCALDYLYDHPELQLQEMQQLVKDTRQKRF